MRAEAAPAVAVRKLAARIGVVVALQSLGNDDGDMDVSVLTTNSEGQEALSAWIVDPTPETEAMTISLAGLFSPPALSSPPSVVDLGEVRTLRFPLSLIKR